VTKAWNKIVAHCNINTTCPLIANTIVEWIKSWFSYINDDKEFNTSYTMLQNYLKNSLPTGNDMFLASLKTLIASVVDCIQDVGRHHFRHRVTLGYIGSSIVEGANPGIKTGDYATKSTMRLDTSSNQQIKQVKQKSLKLGQQMARQMNANNIWSRSGTKHFLTTYMESVTIKNFDNRLNYDVAYEGNFRWYVMNKSVMELHNQSIMPPVQGYCKFVRVYTVHANPDGYMLCNCGYVHEYMVPCVHIMAVIKDKQYLSPSMFHIRWWKHFNYYFCTDEGLYENNDLHKQLQSVHNKSNEESFYANGSFCGCNISPSGFLEQQFSIDLAQSNIVMNVMCAIMKCNDYVGPIVEWTKPYTEFLVNNLTSDNNSEDFNEQFLTADESFGDSFSVDEAGIDINNGIDTLGHAVSASGHLSQQSLSMENMIQSPTPPHPQINVMKGGNLYNYALQVMESIKTDSQRQTFIHFLSEFHANNLKENNPMYSDPAKRKGGTIMLFADESGKPESAKRHRESYEKKK